MIDEKWGRGKAQTYLGSMTDNNDNTKSTEPISVHSFLVDTLVLHTPF